MRKQEFLARFAALLILIGLPVGILVTQSVSLPVAHGDSKVIDLVATRPDAGGWSPEVIRVNKGDTVRLRITATDVVHGFAIGQLGIDVGNIVPGKVTEVEFVADKVGRFTYYCNAWCSPDHYRMRGTLEVVDPEIPEAVPLSQGEPKAAGLDLDSAHEAMFYPSGKPSAARGQTLAKGIQLPAAGDLRSQSPSALFSRLRQGSLSDSETWDLIAYLWSTSTTPERLAAGRALYTKNCTGCHGETGQGNGPGSRTLKNPGPANFTNARTMAGGSSDLYYAKIRRGGMGTGMPYWGTIFTEEETRSLVDYLWTFVFAEEKQE